MKLFLPSARATNWLLIVGFCSIGYALYMRYLAVEQSTVGLACQAGLNTWLCFTRQITIALFTYSAFGWPRWRGRSQFAEAIACPVRRLRSRRPVSESSFIMSDCPRWPSACRAQLCASRA